MFDLTKFFSYVQVMLGAMAMAIMAAMPPPHVFVPTMFVALMIAMIIHALVNHLMKIFIDAVKEFVDWSVREMTKLIVWFFCKVIGTLKRLFMWCYTLLASMVKESKKCKQATIHHNNLSLHELSKHNNNNNASPYRPRFCCTTTTKQTMGPLPPKRPSMTPEHLTHSVSFCRTEK